MITSAGIILAGTFSVRLTLPVTFIFDLGFMVAVGILLDTYIVRTIMVPAAIEHRRSHLVALEPFRSALCEERPAETPVAEPAPAGS